MRNTMTSRDAQRAARANFEGVKKVIANMRHGMSAENVALVESALRLTEGFAQWPTNRLTSLVSQSRLVKHVRGSVFLSEEGDVPETLVIVAGHLMVERIGVDGLPAALGLAGPGLVLGLSVLLNPDEDALFQYRAHEATPVIHIPSAELLAALDAEPFLWRDMARMLLRQKRAMLASYLVQTIGSLSRRVAATLDRLARLYGVQEGKAIRLRLQITQEDLAAMLQVSRPTMNKALNTIADAGLITLDYKTIVIVDLDGLRKFSV